MNQKRIDEMIPIALKCFRAPVGQLQRNKKG